MILIENISKSYGDIKSLTGINAEIGSGSIYGLIGSNGSGKSTLLEKITSGYHYHTVTAKDQKTLKLIEEKLWENGFLAKLQEYEPDEMNTDI